MMRSLCLFCLVLISVGCGQKSPSQEAPESSGKQSRVVETIAESNKATQATQHAKAVEAPKARLDSKIVPKEGSVRVAIVSDELLGSETKALKSATRHFDGRADFSMGLANEAEKKSASLLFQEGAAFELPLEWQSVETVFVMVLRAPRGTKPKRKSAGFGKVAILRPPSREPVYVEHVEGEAGMGVFGIQNFVDFLDTQSEESGSE